MEGGVGLPGGAGPAVDDFCDRERMVIILSFCVSYSLNCCNGELTPELRKRRFGDGGIAAEPAIDGFEDRGMGFVFEGGTEAGEMGRERFCGVTILVGMLKAIAIHEHAVVTIGRRIVPLVGAEFVEYGSAADCAAGHIQPTT